MELLLMFVIVFLVCLMLSIHQSHQDAVPLIGVNRKDWRKGKPFIVQGAFPERALVVPKVLSETEFEAIKKNLIKQNRQNRQRPLVVLKK